jgi:alcohol dehydrogenase class IV
MWYFRSPEIVFGEDALDHLSTLSGERAFIVTDQVMVDLGFDQLVGQHLQQAGLAYNIFSQVAQEPTLTTILDGVAQLTDSQADWIIGLGGGSVMDAAKAMWVLYENPGFDLTEVHPFAELILRQKARLITIPTTSGTGSECTWAFVLTDPSENRKLGLGTPKILPDIAIVDPIFPQKMPPQLTADTAFDALTQAIEGYTASLHNDFSDGLCLKAIQLLFDHLPQAVADGQNLTAREKVHNAATLAGLGFGNAMAALAHSMGHSFGALFNVPHGRAVGLFLPYSIQYTTCGPAPTRYHHISRWLGLPAQTPTQGSESLVTAIRQLAAQVNQPLTIPATLPLSPADFEAALPQLIFNTEADSVIAMSSRIPTATEIENLFRCAYHGQDVNF